MSIQLARARIQRRGPGRISPVLRSGFRGDPFIHKPGSALRRAGGFVLDVLTGQRDVPTIGQLPTIPPGGIPGLPPIIRDPLPFVPQLPQRNGGDFFQGPLPPPPPPPGGFNGEGIALELQFDTGAPASEEQELQILQASIVPLVGARALGTAIIRGGRAFVAKLAAIIRRNPGAVGVTAGMSASQLVEWVRRQPTPKVACPAGHRPNKSSYFLRDGTFVLEGSTCVKIRRRNPLNPRAADRAISRLESAKRAVQRLSRVSIRKKKC